VQQPPHIRRNGLKELFQGFNKLRNPLDLANLSTETWSNIVLASDMVTIAVALMIGLTLMKDAGELAERVAFSKEFGL
jgi:hypothetical protein